MPFASEDTDDPISSLPHQSDTHHLMSLTNGWVVAICTNSCLSLYAQSDCCLPIDVFPGSLRPVSSSSTYYLRWAEGYIYQERSDTGPSCRTSSVKGRHFSIQHRESGKPWPTRHFDNHISSSSLDHGCRILPVISSW